MIGYIALLRGINVGGHKKILMADLRLVLESLQFENVKTYIQSGNIVFQSSEENKALLQDNIHFAIKKHYDFEVPVLVKTISEIKTIVNACPFSEEEKEKSYFMLLFTSPKTDLISTVMDKKPAHEQIEITKNCIYFYSEKGYGKAVCNSNFIEKKLDCVLSARNYRTMRKLIDLVA